jgi:hypothetical protein
MKKLLLLMALAVPLAFGQLQTLTDTLTTPQGGTFSGTIVVTLNNPATAQPLYYSTTTLTGWQQTYTITSGAVSISLYANSTMVPTGTSYTARLTPASGSAWSETWVVPVGATTIREVRSTTVPTPSVLFLPSQLRQQGATVGQGLVWNGAAYAPSSVLADPMTTTGDIITRSGGVPTRLGIGSTGQVLTVAGGLPSWAAPATSGTVTSVSVTTANGVSGTVATATSTPAITLSLGAITPTSVAASGAVSGSNLSGTNTGDQTTITGNAGTATALAANGTNCTAGQFPLGVDASGNSESCTALPTTITGTANQITASGSTGAITLSIPTSPTLPGTTTGTFSGNLTGNVTGNVTGSSGSTTGNSATATVLQTARTIAGVSFNGSANIAIPSTGLSDTADIVRGASAVAATQVLYGVSPGVAGSSSLFKYFSATTGNLTLGSGTDDAVNRLQVEGSGRFAPTAAAAAVSVVGASGFDGNVNITGQGAYVNLNSTIAAPYAGVTLNSSTFTRQWALGMLAGSTTFTIATGASETSLLKLTTAGVLTLRNETATTGVTQVVVRAGAGQSSTNLQTWQDSGGTTMTSITSAGQIVVDAIKSTTGVRYVCVNTSGQLVSQASACVGT